MQQNLFSFRDVYSKMPAREKLRTAGVNCSIRNWKSTSIFGTLLMLKKTQKLLSTINPGTTEIDLQSSRLTEVPAEIRAASALKHLNLANNEIAELPAWIGDLKNLESLCLFTCQIKELPAEIQKCTKLNAIDLTNNPLLGFPTVLTKMTAIEAIDLFGCELESIPAEISDLINLKRLDLEFNKLTRLPTTLERLPKLAELNLKANPLPREIQFLANSQDLSKLLRAIRG